MNGEKNPSNHADEFADSRQAPISDAPHVPPPIFLAEVADSSGGDDSPRLLTEEDLQSPRRRKVALPIVLFIVTCLSTFWAGVVDWMPLGFSTGFASTVVDDGSAWLLEIRMAMIRNWQQGLIYMLCVLAILLTHEMGHFLATIRHRIPASLPFFIPFPISPIGTMGAVIGMEGYKANRRQMFDIGIAGPIAGLLVAVPILWMGIERLDFSRPGHGGMAFDCPWLVRIMIDQLRPEVRGVKQVWLSQLNPYFMAGWVGLLITGLNMLPISQLDGGHVIYTLFQKRAHWVARGFLLLAIAFIVVKDAYMWTPMLLLVTLIGTDHPPTSDDSIPLGGWRGLLGYCSLLIPILCFPVKAVTVAG